MQPSVKILPSKKMIKNICFLCSPVPGSIDTIKQSEQSIYGENVGHFSEGTSDLYEATMRYSSSELAV